MWLAAFAVAGGCFPAVDLPLPEDWPRDAKSFFVGSLATDRPFLMAGEAAESVALSGLLGEPLYLGFESRSLAELQIAPGLLRLDVDPVLECEVDLRRTVNALWSSTGAGWESAGVEPRIVFQLPPLDRLQCHARARSCVETMKLPSGDRIPWSCPDDCGAVPPQSPTAPDAPEPPRFDAELDDCPGGGVHLIGSSGCEPLGTPCVGDFPDVAADKFADTLASLEDVIEGAQPGEIIALSKGAFVIPAEIMVPRDVRIVGCGSETTISSLNGRPFIISQGIVTLESVTIESAEGILVEGGHLEARGVEISSLGHGVRVEAPGSARLHRVVVTAGTAGIRVLGKGSALDVHDSWISGDGRGIDANDDASVQLAGVHVSGGALSAINVEGSTLTFDRVLIGPSERGLDLEKGGAADGRDLVVRGVREVGIVVQADLGRSATATIVRFRIEGPTCEGIPEGRCVGIAVGGTREQRDQSARFEDGRIVTSSPLAGALAASRVEAIALNRFDVGPSFGHTAIYIGDGATSRVVISDLSVTTDTQALKGLTVSGQSSLARIAIAGPFYFGLEAAADDTNVDATDVDVDGANVGIQYVRVMSSVQTLSRASIRNATEFGLLILDNSLRGSFRDIAIESSDVGLLLDPLAGYTVDMSRLDIRGDTTGIDFTAVSLDENRVLHMTDVLVRESGLGALVAPCASSVLTSTSFVFDGNRKAIP